MEWFIPLAAKSVVIAGGALLLLKLLANRSAADRSWIAHLSLAGLLLLPVATFALPTLDVAGPEFLVGKAEVVSPSSALPTPIAEPAAVPAATSAIETETTGAGSAPVNWPFWGYVAPAALLFLLTLIAIVRLFVLKARATVMVDTPWLTALARAQQRMGFKHGTALLTSNELPSPISWGVVRPVILLNADAASSHDEAEAIITHELAHVARLDWAKLLLSRVAVAIFWFNPFVWLLAREAHQLREEAADDAVLATDIDETEYARLLVGVARHECRGLLIGAHGVAPAKNSLARRVKRVLDNAVKRAPGGWRWGSAAAFFAAGMSVPVAALNLVPAAAPATAEGARIADSGSSYYSLDAATVADEIAESPDSAAEAVALANGEAGKIVSRAIAANGATTTTTANGVIIARAPNGATATIYPADRNGRRRVVAVSPDGAVAESYADARAVPGLATAFAHPHVDPDPNPRPKPNPNMVRRNSAVDRAIEMKAVGLTPEYIASMRAAVPNLDHDELVALKAVGVTPDFVRELNRLGYRGFDGSDLTDAYAVGVRSDYIRGLAAVGFRRLSLDELVELKAVGITPADVQAFRRAGFKDLDVDRLTELKALGITPDELKASKDFGP